MPHVASLLGKRHQGVDERDKICSVSFIVQSFVALLAKLSFRVTTVLYKNLL